MQRAILPVLLVLSSSLLLTNVGCAPNHHHNHQNDFPWQNLLSSLGIVIGNETGVISKTEEHSEDIVYNREYYSSESPVGALKSEATEETETLVEQNGSGYPPDNSNVGGGLGVKVGVPVGSIILMILFIYCVCRCCFCRRKEPGVVVMQSNTVQSHPPPQAPQIILQQPIIQQQLPPMYEPSQRWAQPHHGHPQWAPHPMSQHQHYSPTGGHEAYDNPNFNHATAPPPYNTGKY